MADPTRYAAHQLCVRDLSAIIGQFQVHRTPITPIEQAVNAAYRIMRTSRYPCRSAAKIGHSTSHADVRATRTVVRFKRRNVLPSYQYLTHRLRRVGIPPKVPRQFPKPGLSTSMSGVRALSTPAIPPFSCLPEDNPIPPHDRNGSLQVRTLKARTHTKQRRVANAPNVQIPVPAFLPFPAIATRQIRDAFHPYRVLLGDRIGRESTDVDFLEGCAANGHRQIHMTRTTDKLIRLA